MPIDVEVPGHGVVEFPDGMSDDQIADAIKRNIVAPQAEEGPSVAADVAKSAGAGLVKGVAGVVGLPGDMRNLMTSAGEWVGDKLGLKQLSDEQKAKISGALPLPTAAGTTKAIEGVTGVLHTPQTTAGEYAQTAAEFLPAAAAGPGGLARRVVTQAAVPAVASETAGQITKGTEAEPYARMAGAVGGAFLPGMAARAVSPLAAVDPERAAAVVTLRREGVDLTAGQETGSKALRYMESALGDAPGAGGRATAAADRQAEQFTRAALRRAGEDAPRATPEVLDRAFTRIGQQFDDLAARNVARADQQFAFDLTADLQGYRSLVSPPNRVPAVENFAREISEALQRNGGSLPGDVYQSLRSRMEAAARGVANPEARTTIRDMRGSLDDLMERSIAASNPNDLGAWRQARQQYRNVLVIERAASGAGENAALGLISPAQLRQATVGVQGRRNYVRGQGDFADLSRAGAAVMLPMPQSGTAPRMLAQSLPSAAGAAIGALSGGAPGAVFGAMAPVLGPAVAGRAIMSGPVQRYLANQVAAPVLEGLDPRRTALIQAALSANRPQVQAQQ